MTTTERLMKYCKVDTQSDPDSTTSPSTAKQFDLAKILVEDLKAIGIEDAEVDEYCYVYGHLAKNTEKECANVGFIAHMDTAPDYSGTGVNPRVIENYDGKDIVLAEGVVTKVSEFEDLPSLKGKTLMVTDGSTLLGADDKAGIVAIMEAMDYLIQHPEVKHGDISIAFTPDEEVGRGTEHFNYEKFHADFAYTMDGGDIRCWNDETFNAAAAEVECIGLSIHPGSAKDKMINALNTAVEFHNMLPEHMRPEHTEGRDGFMHLHLIEGNADHAIMKYIIRDHDATKFQAMQDRMAEAVKYINDTHGSEVIKITFKQYYRNMKEILLQHPEVSRTAEEALKDIGVDPINEVVRGGTDGSELTYHGVPCPNLGAGGRNCHGRYEYCVMEELDLAVKLIVRISEKVAEA